MDDNNLSRKTRKNEATKRIALFFLVIGIFGWFIPPFDILNYQWVELPNSQPRGLHIDGEGNIFCGSGVYERIQMYNKHGDFIRAFNTDVGKGRDSLFTFKIKNNQLYIHVFSFQVKPERSDREIIYALNGSLLETAEIPSTNYAGYKVKNKTTDSFGRQYVFKGLFWPRVVRKGNNGNTVIISTPIYFWPLQSPFPSFIFSFVPLLYLAGFKNLFRRKEQNLNQL